MAAERKPQIVKPGKQEEVERPVREPQIVTPDEPVKETEQKPAVKKKTSKKNKKSVK